MVKDDKIPHDLLITVLNNRYENHTFINESGYYKKHGKVRKIIYNTHCSFIIVKFENGNELLGEGTIDILMTKYLNKSLNGKEYVKS